MVTSRSAASSSPAIRRVAEVLAQRHGADAAPVATQLHAMLERARKAWPSLAIADEAFLDHIARIAPSPNVAELEAEDLYLAVACAAHEPKALAAFEAAHIAEVPRAISRLRPTSDFVEEIQQQLREKLLVSRDGRAPRIAEYSGRGALGAWVRVAALRTALSSMRRRQAEPSPNTLPDQPAPTPAPDVRAVQARYRPHLKSAVQKALESLAEDDRVLLRRHAIEGSTVEQLGAERGVHGSTISRRLTRIRQSIVEETRRQIAMLARLNESEFTSVVRVLRSDLDVSVRRILGAPRDSKKP